MLSASEKKSLIAKSKLLPVILQVGKNGLSEAFINEFDKIITKKKLVKIRFLRSFADLNDVNLVSSKLASDLGCDLISVVGNTAVFYRK